MIRCAAIDPEYHTWQLTSGQGCLLVPPEQLERQWEYCLAAHKSRVPGRRRCDRGWCGQIHKEEDTKRKREQFGSVAFGVKLDRTELGIESTSLCCVQCAADAQPGDRSGRPPMASTTRLTLFAQPRRASSREGLFYRQREIVIF